LAAGNVFVHGVNSFKMSRGICRPGNIGLSGCDLSIGRRGGQSELGVCAIRPK
jgi:hypothetical protein